MPHKICRAVEQVWQTWWLPDKYFSLEPIAIYSLAMLTIEELGGLIAHARLCLTLARLRTHARGIAYVDTSGNNTPVINAAAASPLQSTYIIVETSTVSVIAIPSNYNDGVAIVLCRGCDCHVKQY